MADIKLIEGGSQKFRIVIRDEKGDPLSLLPGQKVRVFSHNHAAVRVDADATPAEGTIASGTLYAGPKVAADVVIQATVDGGDMPGSNVTLIVDVGTVPPPPPPPEPVPPVVRALAIELPDLKPVPAAQPWKGKKKNWPFDKAEESNG